MYGNLSLALLSLLIGCAYITDDDEKLRLDPDGDGSPIGEDCDDDDGDLTTEVTWYTDADEDGFGAPGTEEVGCSPPAGSVDNDGDCDDGDASLGAVSADVDCDVPDAWNTHIEGVGTDIAGWAFTAGTVTVTNLDAGAVHLTGQGLTTPSGPDGVPIPIEVDDEFPFCTTATPIPG